MKKKVFKMALQDTKKVETLQFVKIFKKMYKILRISEEKLFIVELLYSKLMSPKE